MTSVEHRAPRPPASRLGTPAAAAAGPAVPALVDGYDAVILDLDGVVYLLDQPIPGAVEAVTALQQRLPVRYVTNNASRRASEVATLLASMGIAATPADVLTAAQAAAAMAAQRYPLASPVLVLGSDALRAEVRDCGLQPVDTADAYPHAVIQGYGPAVGWPNLAEACVAIQNGADWYATNTDTTLPSPRGLLPGNGALVAAISTALGRGPDIVVGKPGPGLFTQAAERVGASRVLVVGDRLETDIEGAHAAGMDSVLVLTGVTRPRHLLVAPARQRPTYVATNLIGLLNPVAGGPVPAPDSEVAVGGWTARHTGVRLELTGHGAPLAALLALCAAAWSGPRPQELSERVLQQLAQLE